MQDREAKAAWIAKVLGVQIGGTQTVAVADQDAVLDSQEVKGRVNATGIRLRDFKSHPEFAALLAQFTDAVNALRSGDLAKAVAMLDAVEPALNANAAGIRAANDQPETAAPVISLRQAASAALAWRKACALAEKEVPILKSAIIDGLAADETFDDDDLDEAREKVEALDIVPELFDVDLADAVDNLIATDATRRFVLRDEIMAMIEDHAERLNDNEILAVLPGNSFHAVDLMTPARSALSTLREALAA
jgi:hypothetical protein